MAEGAYASLPAGSRAAARPLLLRLCDAGDEGDLTLRRRLPVAEVADEHDTDAHDALEALADRRLLTIDRDDVEIAHEALMREWPRLRAWLDEDVQGRRLHRRLHDATRSWAAGHDASELYRGRRLEAATDWAADHGDELTQAERGFLDASVEQAEAESRALAERARRDARQNRRLRGLLAGLAVALVVVVLAGAVAVGQRSRADEQRDRAERESATAVGRELAAAAVGNLDVDPERSVLLALAAIDRTRAEDGSVLPEAEEALHRAVTSSRIELRVSDIGGRVDWSPDGSTFVTEGPEQSGIVDIRDATTGESVRSWDGHDGDIAGVAFNHDGTRLATTGSDGAARVWDPATGDELHAVQMPVSNRALPGGNCRCLGVSGPSFSGDGSLFAAAWPEDGIVKVIDVATGRTVREIRSVPGPRDLAFDPTGDRLAIASARVPTAVVVDGSPPTVGTSSRPGPTAR